MDDTFSGHIWIQRSKDAHVTRINRLWYIFMLFLASIDFAIPFSSYFVQAERKTCKLE